jgi:hypothetical protein
MSDVFEQLRKKFDGSDSFVAGGHSVRGGGATRNAARIANTPEWVNDDVQVRLILLKVFPKLSSDSRQREQAARWMRVIYLYFRRGFPRAKVAMIMNISMSSVKHLILTISRASEGKNKRGVVPKRRGRPKKNRGPILATSGNPGRDHISL